MDTCTLGMVGCNETHPDRVASRGGCAHNSQDGFATGSASGWLCLECERVTEWHPAPVVRLCWDCSHPAR